MKPEAQRNQDYEDGYKCAVDDVKRRLGLDYSIEEIVNSRLSIAGCLLTKGESILRGHIRIAFVKGYEQALLDIKNRKIKLEEEK